MPKVSDLKSKVVKLKVVTSRLKYILKESLVVQASGLPTRKQCTKDP